MSGRVLSESTLTLRTSTTHRTQVTDNRYIFIFSLLPSFLLVSLFICQFLLLLPQIYNFFIPLLNIFDTITSLHLQYLSRIFYDIIFFLKYDPLQQVADTFVHFRDLSIPIDMLNWLRKKCVVFLREIICWLKLCLHMCVKAIQKVARQRMFFFL